MNNETEELFKYLIEISKDISSLSNMKKVLDNEDTLNDSILIVDSKSNILSHSMNSYLNLKNHPNIINILNGEINNSLYYTMNLYADYEKAFQMTYPESHLYEVINIYTEYINNSNAITNAIQNAQKKSPIYAKLKIALISNENEEPDLGISYYQDLKFTRKSDQGSIINCLAAITQSSSAYLDDVAQAILSNYNKMKEEKLAKDAFNKIEKPEPKKRASRKKKTTTE